MFLLILTLQWSHKTAMLWISALALFQCISNCFKKTTNTCSKYVAVCFYTFDLYLYLWNIELPGIIRVSFKGNFSTNYLLLGDCTAIFETICFIAGLICVGWTLLIEFILWFNKQELTDPFNFKRTESLAHKIRILFQLDIRFSRFRINFFY